MELRANPTRHARAGDVACERIGVVSASAALAAITGPISHDLRRLRFGLLHKRVILHLG